MQTNTVVCKLRTLIVGYGKIGKIKASLWRSLGAEVYVYDTSVLKSKDIQKEGFSLSSRLDLNTTDDIIVDVSTPAGYHAAGLKWALNYIRNKPKLVLIEKPLASTTRELEEIQRLVQQFDIEDISYVNESYYASLAITEVLTEIRSRKERIQSVNVELSKNRLIDTANGRFFDRQLGAIGIEMPHVLAILQMLDFNITQLRPEDARLIIDKTREDNQGFELRGVYDSVNLHLSSYLGNFRVSDSKLTPNSGIVRRLKLQTSGASYEITFDPAVGVPRYHARIVTIRNSTKSERVIEDNHLYSHLAQLSKGLQSNLIEKFSGICNAVQIVQVLIELRNKVAEVRIPDESKYTAKSAALKNDKQVATI